MDMIAERLGLDLVEFRRKNLLRDGDLFATGENLEGMHYDALLDRAAGIPKLDDERCAVA